MASDTLKGSLRSKTMWFNAAVTAAGIASVVADHAGFVSLLIPGVGPYLAVIGAIGIGLRYLTTQPVWDKVTSDAPIEQPVQPEATGAEMTFPSSNSQAGDG
jgi:hypothetical protein